MLEDILFMHMKCFRTKAATRKHWSADSFNTDASTYDSAYLEYTEDTHPIVLSTLKKFLGKSILDVGCGTGSILSKMPLDVSKYGVDISSKMLHLTKRKLGRVELVVADSESLPYIDGVFNTVTCVLAYHHFVDPETVTKELFRVLIPGGRALIADPYDPSPWHRLHHNILMRAFSTSGDLHFYSYREMKWLMKKAGFTSITWNSTSQRFVTTGVRP